MKKKRTRTGRGSGQYTSERLNRVAFPLGGLGAGMFCVEGAGRISHLSLRHKPEVFNEPRDMFAAVWIKDGGCRVLEGPVPGWKKFGQRGGEYQGAASGGGGTTYGLPRFNSANFRSRFPFCEIGLEDRRLGIDVSIVGWSPFIPGDSLHSCLPVAALEYVFVNPTRRTLEGVFSFNSRNFMTRGDGGLSAVERLGSGLLFRQSARPGKPFEEGSCCVTTTAGGAKVNARWFRGGWFDGLTRVWGEVEKGFCADVAPVGPGESPSPGGSLMVPFTLKPGGKLSIPLLFAWYVPNSDVRQGRGPWGEDLECEKDCTCRTYYKPWYAARFGSIDEIAALWTDRYADLRRRTLAFTDCFYDTNLPAGVVEAVSANLSILKTPTILRQEDGRLWAWEGCHDDAGCCHGSCTHVWNYAQAIPHLFPDLERSFRQTEFRECQDEKGDQTFRASLPIAAIPGHKRPPAADGQLGGLMRVYREWRVSGDTEWLRALWPDAKKSLDYCIGLWDPDRLGAVVEPHHNTYDIEFWGPDAMCTVIYLGALRAAVAMGNALGEEMSGYTELADRAKRYAETELFNGTYFDQKVRWKDLKAKNPVEDGELLKQTYNSPEAIELCRAEGPKYQYGTGCLSDQLLGQFEARACGLDGLLDPAKVRRAMKAIVKHNLKTDLSLHVNPQRPTYACGKEGGLILCSWPAGGKPSLPFPYSDEVWTGIEYQVACGLIYEGLVGEGLAIVRILRARYDGRIRNPYDEYECGHWYARALASYGLLQALTGIRYDAVTRTLSVDPRVKGDFRSFLSTATGFGTAGMRNGKPFIEVKSGSIPVDRIEYVRPAGAVKRGRS